MSRPLRLSDGDLAVRKFYRPAVLTHTGVSRGAGPKRQLEFANDDGETMWEYASQLRQLRLYAVLKTANNEQIRRRAYAIARIASARLGRI